MKTILKCHTQANNYDGYAPHHHWMLLDIDPRIYYLFGRVFPGKELATIVMNPYRSGFIRNNVRRVGYDFNQLVDEEHRGLYAFGDLHDGIDGETTSLRPSNLITTLYTNYINPNGLRSSCEVYAVDDKDVLGENECWLEHPTEKRLIKGVIREGTSYIPEQTYKALFPKAKWDATKRTATRGE